MGPGRPYRGDRYGVSRARVFRLLGIATGFFYARSTPDSLMLAAASDEAGPGQVIFTKAGASIPSPKGEQPRRLEALNLDDKPLTRSRRTR
jgi:hypothetical protein